MDVSTLQIPNSNAVTVRVAIPLGLFDSVKPLAGQTCYGNFARTRKSPAVDYVWEPNLRRKAWQNKLDELGKITFK